MTVKVVGNLASDLLLSLQTYNETTVASQMAGNIS